MPCAAKPASLRRSAGVALRRELLRVEARRGKLGRVVAVPVALVARVGLVGAGVAVPVAVAVQVHRVVPVVARARAGPGVVRPSHAAARRSRTVIGPVTGAAQRGQPDPGRPVAGQPAGHHRDHGQPGVGRVHRQVDQQALGGQRGHRGGTEHQQHRPPAGLVPGPQRGHRQRDQDGDHDHRRDDGQQAEREELVVRPGQRPVLAERLVAQHVGGQDHGRHHEKTAQAQPGGEPHDQAARGYLGHPPGQPERRDQAQAELCGTERGRLEATVVPGGLGGQPDGHPGQRQYPGHQVNPGGLGAAPDQQDDGHQRSQRPDRRDEERNRH